ncbi:MAG: DUF3501 family protein [Alphaproteobacteria bacterium]|nr:DUF3501 family protein [Alphaproteobacteria bacterium]
MTPRRVITRADLLPLAEYAAERKARRAAIARLKRDRRVEVGPHATFHFESYETMWMQVHEMLLIEKGGEAQIADELAAYNPLIPQGSELIATFMLEIDDPVRRARVLAGLGGIEQTITLSIDGQVVQAVQADDAERTTEEGKASAIHFLRFPFTGMAAQAFRAPKGPVVLGISHPGYGHLALLPEPVRQALAKDLD